MCTWITYVYDCGHSERDVDRCDAWNTGRECNTWYFNERVAGRCNNFCP